MIRRKTHFHFPGFKLLMFAKKACVVDGVFRQFQFLKVVSTEQNLRVCLIYPIPERTATA